MVVLSSNSSSDVDIVVQLVTKVIVANQRRTKVSEPMSDILGNVVSEVYFFFCEICWGRGGGGVGETDILSKNPEISWSKVWLTVYTGLILRLHL